MITAFYSKTHIGARKNNQDALLALLNAGPFEGLFAVADGLGGHSGGEQASRIALEVLSEMVNKIKKLPNDLDGEKFLFNCALSANERVYRRNLEEPSLNGMATTLTAAAFSGDFCFIAHVGDSRAYFGSLDGEIKQATNDHSYVADLMRKGIINSDEAATHRKRNMLTDALGISETVKIDSLTLDLSTNEFSFAVLCSDGLYNAVLESKIADIALNSPEPAEELIKTANEVGETDNISAIVIKFLEKAS